MSDDIAQYSFLPWLRRGIANSITTADNDRAVKTRAKINVALTATGNPPGGGAPIVQPVAQDIALYGPGDVVGIDVRAIFRTDPRPWITNYEPNYLAAVEFYDDEGHPGPRPTFLQFPADPLLRGQRILIVDEVWDSGTTIHAVTERVRQAGGIPTTVVLGSAPLADQKRSRGELAQRSYAYWPPGMRILRHALEQPARGRLETAEHALLHPVGNRAHQQITAETGRRLGFVEDLPTRSQLVDVQ